MNKSVHVENSSQVTGYRAVTDKIMNKKNSFKKQVGNYDQMDYILSGISHFINCYSTIN